MSSLEAVDWFLGAGKNYQDSEPTRAEELLALLTRDLAICHSDEERVKLERGKAALQAIHGPNSR